MALRAVVIGAGWSAEGHTKALQSAGADIAALCGRSPEPARALAYKLGVAEVCFDWRRAYSWFHQLSQGGGALNVDFTNFLSQVLFITGGKLISVAGEARRLIEHAPQGNLASVLFQGSEMAADRCPKVINFHGTYGALRLQGYFFPETIEHFNQAQQTWAQVNLPDDILVALGCTEDPVQNAWCKLLHEFVSDVRGETQHTYPTFYDGWIANQVVDYVRNNSSWTHVRERPVI